MVLHKKRPVTYHRVEVPTDDTTVWYIAETEEVFTDYVEFVQRAAFYDRKEFVCELSGKSGLTYRQACQSEQDKVKVLEKTFPEILKLPVLRRAQHSQIQRFDALVDAIYDEYRNNFLAREWILYSSPEHGKWDAFVLERVEVGDLVDTFGNHKPEEIRYTIELPWNYPSDPKVMTVDAGMLSRDRLSFTKVVLKSYLKAALRRDGPIWAIRDLFLKRYRLWDPRVPHPTKIPPKINSRSAAKPTTTIDAAAALTVDQTEAAKDAIASNATAAREEEDDDLKVHGEDLEQLPRKPVTRPVPQQEPGLARRKIGVLLETWTFLNVFLEILLLDSFTLDDFADAIRSSQESELLDEVFCALLKCLVVIPKRKNKAGEDEEVHPLPPSHNPLPSLRPISPISAAADGESGAQEEDLIEGQAWRDILVSRKFGGNAWIGCIVGVLQNLPAGYSRAPLMDTIVDDLLEGDENELPARFFALTGDLKLEILSVLVDLLWDVPGIRAYLDECMEHCTKLRKDRADAAKVKRQFMDQIYKLRVRMRTQYPRPGTLAATQAPSNGPSTNGMKHEDAGSEGDDEYAHRHRDDDEDSMVLAPSRRASARLSKKGDPKETDSIYPDEEEDFGPRTTEAVAAIIAEFEKETNDKFYESREAYNADIERGMRLMIHADDRVREVEEDFRESDAQRLRKLGDDRFYNSYWWLEASAMPVHGMPDTSTAHAGYAAARVFVRGPHRGFQEDIAAHPGAAARREKEEQAAQGGMLKNDEHWGYYASGPELDQLLEYLNPRGEREAKLRSALLARRALLAECMQNRTDYLSSATDMEENGADEVADDSAQLQRYQSWRNNMAFNNLGHTHACTRSAYRGRAVSKKRKRSRW
ncbi:hypothetical protein PYCC9005_001446 [Savitreella phatthalungensis]